MGRFDSGPKVMTTEQQDKAKTTGEHPVTQQEMKRLFTWHDIRTIGSVVAAIVVGTVSAWQLLIHEARAQSDAGVKPLERQVETLDRQVQAHEAESRRVHSEMKDELNEVQADIRALYKAVMTKEPQPRLENPDGGR